MAVLVFDAGVLIAHERGDRAVAAWLDRAARAGVDLAAAVTTVARCGAMAHGKPGWQGCWRPADSPNCDDDLARASGGLLARSGSSNPLDALLVAVARASAAPSSRTTSTTSARSRLAPAARAGVPVVSLSGALTRGSRFRVGGRGGQASGLPVLLGEDGFRTPISGSPAVPVGQVKPSPR